MKSLCSMGMRIEYRCSCWWKDIRCISCSTNAVCLPLDQRSNRANDISLSSFSLSLFEDSDKWLENSSVSSPSIIICSELLELVLPHSMSMAWPFWWLCMGECGEWVCAEEEEQWPCDAMDELERLAIGSKPLTGIFQQERGCCVVVSRAAVVFVCLSVCIVYRCWDTCLREKYFSNWHKSY